MSISRRLGESQGEDSPLEVHETTEILFRKAKQGDKEAENELFERYLPRIQRLANRCVPSRIRNAGAVDDLVQNVLSRAFTKVKEFKWKGEGCYLNYLRRSVLNEIRDWLRREKPPSLSLDSGFQDDGRSPLEMAIGSQVTEEFEKALRRLPEKQQEAYILHVEFGYKYREMAEMIDVPSENAARMRTVRAIEGLSRSLDRKLFDGI